MATLTSPSSLRPRGLRIGYIALTDAAPLIVAREKGLFAQHGLEVTLSREVGWATIREKIIYGELDAAHCLAPMLWSIHLGIDSVRCPVLTGLILSQHGNAITLSERLWQDGVRDMAALREAARRRTGESKLTFGVVFQHSSHHVLLRSWLSAGGINPDRDVRIVVVPPAQMFRNLAAGTIDGFCAGEPWNSLAVRERVGWCPTWSSAHFFSPVEKVLLVTERFAARADAEHRALLAALLEACAWCDGPAGREELPELLAATVFTDLSPAVIAPSLRGHFDLGHGQVVPAPDFHVFYRGGANLPSAQKAEALQADLLNAGLLNAEQAAACPPDKLFREDLLPAPTPKPSPNELVAL